MINIRRFDTGVDYRDLPWMLNDEKEFALKHIEPYPMPVRTYLKENSDKICNLVIAPHVENEVFVYQIDYFIYTENEEDSNSLKVLKWSEFEDNKVSEAQVFYIPLEVYINLMVYAEQPLYFDLYDVD